uniref:Uncharacterized protein n=1 Tax=Romanomermis culicivorax TaxID=13658 RepID=A0A915HSP5_ROMCU
MDESGVYTFEMFGLFVLEFVVVRRFPAAMIFLDKLGNCLRHNRQANLSISTSGDDDDVLAVADEDGAVGPRKAPVAKSLESSSLSGAS